MNKCRHKKIASCLLIASLLLSFWICVENCHAEENQNFKTSGSVFDNFKFEKTETDFCAVQNAPSVLFSNQETIAEANFILLSEYSPKLSVGNALPHFSIKRGVYRLRKPPLQFLRQLRI